jgi:hypothetical protein
MNGPCVTEWRRGDAAGPGALATGVADRAAANAEHIRLTLQRLEQHAEAG